MHCQVGPFARVVAALVMLAGIGFAAPATAQEAGRGEGLFVHLPERPDLLYLDGPIVDGAGFAFTAMLADAPGIRTLVLNSIGGQLGPALQIAFQLRAAGIDTYVPPGAVCYSACPILFAAGAARRADGDLGVHAVYAAVPDLPVKFAYRGLGAILDGFGVDGAGLADLMPTITPEEMHILSAAELERYSLEAAGDTMGDRLPVPALDGASRAFLYYAATEDAPTIAAEFGAVAWQRADDGAGPAVEAVVHIAAYGLALRLVIGPSEGGGIAVEVNTLDGDDRLPIEGVAGIATALRNLSALTYLTTFGAPIGDGATRLAWPAAAQAQNLARIAEDEALVLILRLAGDREAFLVLPKGASGSAVLAEAIAAWAALVPLEPAPVAAAFGDADFAMLRAVEPRGRPVTLTGRATWTASPGGVSIRVSFDADQETVGLAIVMAPDGTLRIEAEPAKLTLLGGTLQLARIDIWSYDGPAPHAPEPVAIAPALVFEAADAAAFLDALRTAGGIVVVFADRSGTREGTLTIVGRSRVAMFDEAFGRPP